MAAGGVHYLQQDAALASQTDAAGPQLAFEMAGEFVIDAFAGGDAMCWCGGHVYNEIIPKGVKGREGLKDLTRSAQRTAEDTAKERVILRFADDDVCRLVSGGFGLPLGCRCTLRRRKCPVGRPGLLGRSVLLRRCLGRGAECLRWPASGYGHRPGLGLG